MTRIEALRILVRYMPERSIHITEHLDSCYCGGDRNDTVKAMVTVNPGITKPEIETFLADTIDGAVCKTIVAINPHIRGVIGALTASGTIRLDTSSLSRFNAEQANQFETLNAQ